MDAFSSIIDDTKKNDALDSNSVYKGKIKPNNSCFLAQRPSLKSAEDKEEPDLGIKIRSTSFDGGCTNEISVYGLPRSFMVKYLGKRNCSGLSGLDVIKGPLKEILSDIRKNRAVRILSWFKITVTEEHVNLVEEISNTGKTYKDMTLPLSVLSYAAQHPKYRQLISIIEARRLSAKSYMTQCHVISCQDENQAVALALTIKRAFISNNGSEELLNLQTPVDKLFKKSKDSEV